MEQRASTNNGNNNNSSSQFFDANDDVFSQFNIVKVQEGVVLVQELLTAEEQQVLLQGIYDSSSTHKPSRARNPNSVFTKTIAFDCKKNYDKVPQAFKDYALRATQLAHSVSSMIPPAYQPDYVTSFTYPVVDGRLTGHVDKVLGWVVLFSLGCTAQFYLQSPQLRDRYVFNFQSGDVLVFNGGTEYEIYHGIDRIVPNTCPGHLPSLKEARVSLQLRQSERNDNKQWRDIQKQQKREYKQQQLQRQQQQDY